MQESQDFLISSNSSFFLQFNDIQSIIKYLKFSKMCFQCPINQVLISPVVLRSKIWLTE